MGVRLSPSARHAVIILYSEQLPIRQFIARRRWTGWIQQRYSKL